MIAHVRRMGWIAFWVAVVILGLIIVPVMNNTSAVPTVVFSVTVLAIFSGLWGTGMLGRQLAMSGAAIALTLSILSFFLPQTAKRVPDKIKALDTWLATPTTAATTAAAPVAEPVPNIIRGTTPAEFLTNFEFNLEAKQDIKVTYDDGQSYVHRANADECQQAPTPTTLGPKKFTDPNNEKGGHIAFNLYRLRRGEGTC